MEALPDAESVLGVLWCCLVLRPKRSIWYVLILRAAKGGRDRA